MRLVLESGEDVLGRHECGGGLMGVVAYLVQRDELVRKAIGGHALGHLHGHRGLHSTGQPLELRRGGDHLSAGEREGVVRQIGGPRVGDLVVVEVVVVVVRGQPHGLYRGECRRGGGDGLVVVVVGRTSRARRGRGRRGGSSVVVPVHVLLQ